MEVVEKGIRDARMMDGQGSNVGSESEQRLEDSKINEVGNIARNVKRYQLFGEYVP